MSWVDDSSDTVPPERLRPPIGEPGLPSIPLETFRSVRVADVLHATVQVAVGRCEVFMASNLGSVYMFSRMIWSSTPSPFGVLCISLRMPKTKSASMK